MSPINIFYAEDNKGDVKLLRHALDAHTLDYNLSVSPDGEKALLVLNQIGSHDSPPDLILLDLNLPKVNGHELLQAIRRNPAGADIPVIILTSSDAPRDRQRAAKLGATLYFLKPPDLDGFNELALAVRQVIDR